MRNRSYKSVHKKKTRIFYFFFLFAASIASELSKLKVIFISGFHDYEFKCFDLSTSREGRTYLFPEQRCFSSRKFSKAIFQT